MCLSCGAPAVRVFYLLGREIPFDILLDCVAEAKHDAVFELEVQREGLDAREVDDVATHGMQVDGKRAPALVPYQLTDKGLHASPAS